MKICKFCNKDNLLWRFEDNSWILLEKSGERHYCPINFDEEKFKSKVIEYKTKYSSWNDVEFVKWFNEQRKDPFWFKMYHKASIKSLNKLKRRYLSMERWAVNSN